jgi:mono/diheme cytochrome c family protein
MKGFRLGRDRVVKAAAGLAVALSGALWALPLPSSAATAPAPSAGAKVYNKWCADCHAVGGPGSQALERKYQGQTPAVLRERTDLAPDFVGAVVRQGMSFMPTFRKTEISDAELAQLGAYLASSGSAKARAKAAPKKAGKE